MTDVDALIHQLLLAAKSMDGLPPYERRPIELSLVELTLITKGLGLLAGVRAAVK